MPNGNPAPGPKFDYKLRWFDRLATHAAELLVTGMPVVLVGDFNVMPTEFDVYKPKRGIDDALFWPEVREAFHGLLAQGWTDAVRALHPGERIYTFWDYFRNAWARNASLRIDLGSRPAPEAHAVHPTPQQGSQNPQSGATGTRAVASLSIQSLQSTSNRFARLDFVAWRIG